MIRLLSYRPRLRGRGLHGLTHSAMTTAHLVLIAWCAFRIAALGKAIAESPSIIGTADSPAALWVLLGAVLVETIVLLTALIRTRGMPSLAIVATDVVLVGIVALSPIFYPSTATSAQLPWQFALVFTAICLAAMRVSSVAWTVVIAIALSALYLTGRYAQTSWPSPAVAAASGFTILMVFSVGAAFSRHLMAIAHRMESLVETNIKLAARAAVANERASQRIFLHDTAGLLAMIANTSDPELGAVLKERARATSKELRAYVYEERQSEVGPTRSLHEILERVRGEFRDLPIEQNTLLAKNAFLNGDAIQAIDSAMRTLLDNIRVHAKARTVIVHGRATAGGWEVTVRDDGVGFDPDRTKKGFGLRDQVESQCALAGISVRIASQPGEGTEVRLYGNSSPLLSKSAGKSRAVRPRVNIIQQWRAVRGRNAERSTNPR